MADDNEFEIEDYTKSLEPAPAPRENVQGQEPADEATVDDVQSTEPDAGEAEREAARIQARKERTGQFINQLQRDRRSAENFATQALAEAQELRKQLAASKTQTDYASDEDFMRAAARDEVQRRELDQKQRQAFTAQQAADQAKFQEFHERANTVRERHADFYDVALNPDLDITPAMAEVIRVSPAAGEVSYFLGKNPREATRIASLSPGEQAIEIVNLQTRFMNRTPSQTKAPPPPQTISGRSGGAAKSLDKMSYAEYKKARGF